MLNRTYDQTCSIARGLEVLGERWTLLIVRDIFLGQRRFDRIQKNLGVARNVLASRLERLADEGIIERRAYQERPPRYEYLLTEKGIELWPVLMALHGWGARYAADSGGPPFTIHHKGCEGVVDMRGCCELCGERLEARDAHAVRTSTAFRSEPKEPIPV